MTRTGALEVPVNSLILIKTEHHWLEAMDFHNNTNEMFRSLVVVGAVTLTELRYLLLPVANLDSGEGLGNRPGS